VSGHLKQGGGISYEVVLKRRDPVPWEEILKRPTNADLDDYMEYNRLRRHHYESKHRNLIGNVVKFAFHLPVRDAPPIRPTLVSFPSSDSGASISGVLIGSSASSMTLNRPTFNLSSSRRKLREVEAHPSISPRTVFARGNFPFAVSDSPDYGIPAQNGPRRPAQEHVQTQSTNNLLTNTSKLMEIIPWIDQEPDPEPSPPMDRPTQSGKGGILDTVSSTESKPLPKNVPIDDSSHALTHTRYESPKRDWTKIKTISLRARSGSHKKTRSRKDPPAPPHDSKTSSVDPGLTRSISSGQPNRVSSSHNPRAIVSNPQLIPTRSTSSIRSYQCSQSCDPKDKSFHGGGDSTHDSDDYFSLPMRDVRAFLAYSSTLTRRRSHEASVESPSGIVRSNAPVCSIVTPTKILESPLRLRRARSSSESPIDLITRARPAAPMGSPTSTPVIWRGKESRANEGAGSVWYTGDGVEGVRRDSQVMFTDPFVKDKRRRVLRRWSSGVAPDTAG
jgi:hypothetical protein